MVHDPRAPSVLLSLILAVAACGGKGTANTDAEATPAGEAEAAKQGATTKVKPAEPLTQEEKDLIAADPKDLTPELRRKRAFALRKKIMQNPDSPTARTLEELKRAALAGEIEVPGYTPEGGAKKNARLEANKPPAPAAGTAPENDKPTK